MLLNNILFVGNRYFKKILQTTNSL